VLLVLAHRVRRRVWLHGGLVLDLSASWCGKKVVPEKIRQRPGWDAIPAVRNNRLVEIKSPLILQPGPAALTDGLDAICTALAGLR
jgi:iron complex transport system substrate-binding protein